MNNFLKLNDTPHHDMTDKFNNARYIYPQMKVIMVSITTQILNTSLDGNPSVNGYRDGSESCIVFGDEDE